MYRLVLGCLLALALMDLATACPPADPHVTIVDGKEVIEWYCAPGKVMAMHENIYRCFDPCPSCPNGFCHENKCHCLPGTIPEAPGVCGKICPNCANGWCSSPTKCECNSGFILTKGQCVRPVRKKIAPSGHNNWPAKWSPHQPAQQYPQRQPPQDRRPKPPPEDEGFGKLEGRMDDSESEYMPQYFRK